MVSMDEKSFEFKLCPNCGSREYLESGVRFCRTKSIIRYRLIDKFIIFMVMKLNALFVGDSA